MPTILTTVGAAPTPGWNGSNDYFDLSVNVGSAAAGRHLVLAWTSRRVTGIVSAIFDAAGYNASLTVNHAYSAISSDNNGGGYGILAVPSAASGAYTVRFITTSAYPLMYFRGAVFSDADASSLVGASGFDADSSYPFTSVLNLGSSVPAGQSVFYVAQGAGLGAGDSFYDAVDTSYNYGEGEVSGEAFAYFYGHVPSTVGGNLSAIQLGSAGWYSQQSVGIAGFRIATASGGSGIAGTLAATLGAVTSSAAARLSIRGTTTATLAGLTRSITGTLAIKGTSAPTLAAVTSVSAAKISLRGTTNATLGALALSSTGKLAASGSLSVSLAALTLAATGGSGKQGVLVAQLDALTLSATATLPVTGSVAATLADITVDSSATNGSPETPPVAWVGGGGFVERDERDRQRRERRESLRQVIEDAFADVQGVDTPLAPVDAVPESVPAPVVRRAMQMIDARGLEASLSEISALLDDYQRQRITALEVQRDEDDVIALLLVA